MPTDFIVLRLVQLFVYYFLDIPYLFAISNVTEQIESTGAKREDPVLGLDAWKVKQEQVIYGLPAIDNQSLYFLPIPVDMDGPWVDVELRG
jgi:hypothetical protein